MDILGNLAMGFGVALTPLNIGLCLVGALVGTLIGVLPGLGPIATIAMLLPLTFNLDATGALIMLAGIYYGAQYGGSTTAILVNMPGETSSVVTTLDGHQMARQGRAGAALGLAALGSFFAGCVATMVVAVLGPVLAGVAQQFGAAEYFALMVVGLVAATVLASGSVLKAVAMILVGLLLGTVGSDVETGAQRLTLGLPQLADGIEFTTLAIGLFGIAEIVRNLERPEERGVLGTKIKGLLPTWADIRQSIAPVLRGTALGSVLGILPGNGAVLAPYASYTLEKKLARDPSRFGRGAVEGVAGPEAANNAGAQTSFVPLLTLGIPPNAVMALMVGAMTIQGIIPGPQVMTTRPDLFWGMIASMWIGNLMLVVINLPMIGVWVKLLSVPYRLLYPAILLFCCIGVFSVNNQPFAVLLVAVFGFVGYALGKLGFEAAPLLLAFVLGPLMEENLRRALQLSRGDPFVFFQRPISLALLMIALGLLLIVLLPSVRKKREEAFHEE
ncbi:MAG TPA: tripartite tricarboxylate transporter permease [Alphaproteobacteria bacterium]|nr:tripartite tricarboxylate transporter permease [Alphaproteobacteria bacterium]